MTCPLPRSTNFRFSVPAPNSGSFRSSGQTRHVPGTRTTCYSENPPVTVTTCRPGFLGSRVCQTRHVPGTRTACYSDRLGSYCETDAYRCSAPICQRTYYYDSDYSYSPRSHGSAAGAVLALLALTFVAAACL